MRIKIAVATLSLLALTLAYAPVSAQSPRAHLRLLVVDRTNAPLPNAAVTIYTLDGRPGVTVIADESGTVVLPNVTPGMTQIVAKSLGYSTTIEKATLHAGDNTQTVTLQAKARES